MELKVKKMHPQAKLPEYMTDGAGCFDLFAATVAGSDQFETTVRIGLPVVCGTGLAFEIPKGYVMLIFSRSGQGFKRATRLANCVGLIDSDYRGEVMVKLTRDISADDCLAVMPGHSIAQGMVVPSNRIQKFVEVEELGLTDRGENGFGSTDRNFIGMNRQQHLQDPGAPWNTHGYGEKVISDSKVFICDNQDLWYSPQEACDLLPGNWSVQDGRIENKNEHGVVIESRYIFNGTEHPLAQKGKVCLLQSDVAKKRNDLAQASLDNRKED